MRIVMFLNYELKISCYQDFKIKEIKKISPQYIYISLLLLL